MIPSYQEENQYGYDDNSYQASPMMDPDISYNEESKGVSGIVWVVIVIVAIVIIVGIILIIWWATRSKDTTNDTGPLAITGTSFKAISSTSIEATWVRVGNEKDIVTLYVNPTGKTMNFDSNGQPLGVYSSSGQVTFPGTSATVSNLTPGASYDAILIVTNPDVKGVNQSKHQSAITTSAPLPSGSKFTITSSGQPGHIHYNISPTPGSSTVGYSLNTAPLGDSLFMRDSDGYVCATTLGQMITPDSKCEDGSSVLYSSASTGDANLNIGRKSSLDATQLGNAKWSYNTTNNQWCVSGSTTRCMTYSVDSSFVPLVPTGTAPIPPPIVDDVTTNQPIFITSNGSRWTNKAVPTN